MNTLTCPPLTISNETYQFHSTKDNSEASLLVSKNETDRVYAIAIKYIGLHAGSPHWEVYVSNDSIEPTTQTPHFHSFGGRSLKFNVNSQGIVSVKIVDDKGESTRNIDLALPALMDTLTLPPTTVVNKTYKFHSPKDNSNATLKVVKKETDRLVYTVAIKYMGMLNRRPRWEIFLSKECVEFPNSPSDYNYFGSQMMKFKVVTKNIVRLNEVDENEECIRYYDLSRSVGRVSKLLPPPCIEEGGIAGLIEKAKAFMTNDGAKPSRIYFRDDVVLFTVKIGNSLNYDVYVADINCVEFLKCPTSNTGVSWMSCEYDVEFNGRTHKFSFVPMGGPANPELDHWDNQHLTIIS